MRPETELFIVKFPTAQITLPDWTNRSKQKNIYYATNLKQYTKYIYIFNIYNIYLIKNLYISLPQRIVVKI